MQLNKKRAKGRRQSILVSPHGGKRLKGPLVLVQEVGLGMSSGLTFIFVGSNSAFMVGSS